MTFLSGTMKMALFLALVFLKPTVFGEKSDNVTGNTRKPVDSVKVDQKGTVKCGTRPYDTAKLSSRTLRSVQNENSSVHLRFDQDKIVGGSEAGHGEIPWQASVKMLTFKNGTYNFIHHCGAAVISEYWLLCAAHCFYMHRLNGWRVTVSDHHLFREDPGQQEFKVEVFYHKKYGSYRNDYDIALLKIKPAADGSGIQFNDFVQPICLPDSKENLKDDTRLLISGWGGTLPCVNCQTELQIYSDVILKAVVPSISHKQCTRTYGPLLTDNMFCAGYSAGHVDACQNDSGGPVVSKTGDRFVLQGIVSWGGGCAQPNRPGVYARVAAFLPWIQSTIKSKSLNSRQSKIPSISE